MKFAFIFLLFPLLFFAGCSSPKYTVSAQDMEILSAAYQMWSEQPSAGSDIPERGVDLWITVRNWPETYQPSSVIYNRRKSISAQIVSQNGDQAVIKARIVQASAVLVETSKTVDVSDRLVFADAEGNKGYLSIESWKSRNRKSE